MSLLQLLAYGNGDIFFMNNFKDPFKTVYCRMIFNPEMPTRKYLNLNIKLNKYKLNEYKINKNSFNISELIYK